MLGGATDVKNVSDWRREQVNSSDTYMYKCVHVCTRPQVAWHGTGGLKTTLFNLKRAPLNWGLVGDWAFCSEPPFLIYLSRNMPKFNFRGREEVRPYDTKWPFPPSVPLPFHAQLEPLRTSFTTFALRYASLPKNLGQNSPLAHKRVCDEWANFPDGPPGKYHRLIII